MSIDSFETQARICPMCHDDHGLDAKCSPIDNKVFMPAESDNSGIAIEYRKRIDELNHVHILAKRINDIIFAKGLILGSNDYFEVRQICIDLMGAKPVGQKEIIPVVARSYGDFVNWAEENLRPTIKLRRDPYGEFETIHGKVYRYVRDVWSLRGLHYKDVVRVLGCASRDDYDDIQLEIRIKSAELGYTL